MKSMLSFLWRKKYSGVAVQARAVPVVATAVGSPANLLARKGSGRKVRTTIETSTVFNQFEQLKRFQNAQNLSPGSPVADKIKETKPFPKIPLLVLVAILSAVTASIVVLVYATLFIQKPIVVVSSSGLGGSDHMQYQVAALPSVRPQAIKTGNFQLGVFVANLTDDNKLSRQRPRQHRKKVIASLAATLDMKIKDVKWRRNIAEAAAHVVGAVKKELSITHDDLENLSI